VAERVLLARILEPGRLSAVLEPVLDVRVHQLTQRNVASAEGLAATAEEMSPQAKAPEELAPEAGGDFRAF
jgi:hypothetical protein